MTGQQTLSASYKSPESSHVFSHNVDMSQGAQSLAQQTKSLAGLSDEAARLQGEINQFLTQKMGEEQSQGQTRENPATAKDEANAEDNYGEEVDDS